MSSQYKGKPMVLKTHKYPLSSLLLLPLSLFLSLPSYSIVLGFEPSTTTSAMMPALYLL
jgi:hypothetical protein